VQTPHNPHLDLDNLHSDNLVNPQHSEQAHSVPPILHSPQHSDRRRLQKQLSDRRLHQRQHQPRGLDSVNLHLDKLRNLHHKHQLSDQTPHQQAQTLSHSLPPQLPVDLADSDNQLPPVDLGPEHLVVPPLLLARLLLLHRQQDLALVPRQPLPQEARTHRPLKPEAHLDQGRHLVHQHSVVVVEQTRSAVPLQRQHSALDLDLWPLRV
jgi:hypothetical protein